MRFLSRGRASCLLLVRQVVLGQVPNCKGRKVMNFVVREIEQTIREALWCYNKQKNNNQKVVFADKVIVCHTSGMAPKLNGGAR